MSYQQTSRNTAAQPTIPMAWMPAFFGLAVIWMESTALMSGANTSRWLLELCHALWGQRDGVQFEETHLFLRKLGHFCGYGVLSLLMRRGWYSSVRRSWEGSRNGLRATTAMLAVSSTLVVACLDEWHQSVLPGRVSSPVDVMIDTVGAMIFNAGFVVMMERRRRALLAQ